MADNVTLNSGSGGATAAADDIGGVHHQRVKLSVGADGSASDAIPVSNGLDTTAAGVQAVGLVAQLDDAATGTVTENQFAPVRLSTRRALLVEGVASGTAQPISGTVTAEQATAASLNCTEASAAAIKTAVEIMDDWDESDRAKVNPIAGQAGVQGASGVVTALTQRVVLATDVALPAGTNAIGKLAANSGVDIGDVDVTSVIAGTGATNLGKAEDAAHASGDTGVMALAVRNDTRGSLAGTDGDYAPPQLNSAGDVRTELSSLAGTAVAVNNGAASAGVQRVTVANDSTGILAGVTTVTTVTTVSTLTGGGVAHDGADSGNPHKIGAKAETSPKGITLVADGDRSDLYCDADGILMVKTGTAYGDLVTERIADTGGTSTNFTNFSAVANTRNFVTCVTIHNSHATTNGYVDFRDGSAGSVIWTFPAPATGGCVVHFNPPLRQATANTALAYDVSAAISTVYISVNGFQSKA